MTDYWERLLYRVAAEQANKEVRAAFESLGQDGLCYTDKQKQLAFQVIEESGVGATAKILNVPRRTLQRWCRKHGVKVKPCPDWVRPWAKRRRRRRECWERRGYS